MQSGIFIEPISGLTRSNNKIKLVYGETYDQFGITIDSLKYYFIINTLHNLLQNKGYKIESTIIIGDSHSVRNDSAKKELIFPQIKKNIELIGKIKRKFNLKCNFKLMSNLFQTKEFKANLDKVNLFFKNNQKSLSDLKRTVQKDKLNEEIKKNFSYTREELALILNYDIKIGPPKEKNYDNIAKKINHNLIGIYVKPTYPLGKKFDFYINHENIEKFGLTPYKGGSYKLNNNRITLNNYNLKTIQELINNSYIPQVEGLPNPVLDLFIVLNLAKRSINNDFNNFSKYKINNDKVKTLSQDIFNKIISEIK